jgi:hypothetical protein
MFNTLCLAAALMLGTAEAGKKHHHARRPHRPPPKAHVHHGHRHAPPRHVVHHVPHRFLVWSWVPGHYNVHGFWIKGHWTFTYRMH